MWVTPSGVVYIVAAGTSGVWLAGLMKPQPNAITSSTMVTLVTTMMELTKADSRVPRTRSMVRRRRMPTAGRFMMPCTGTIAVPVWFIPIVSNGECRHS
jgi:hypothetical protein